MPARSPYYATDDMELMYPSSQNPYGLSDPYASAGLTEGHHMGSQFFVPPPPAKKPLPNRSIFTDAEIESLGDKNYGKYSAGKGMLSKSAIEKPTAAPEPKPPEQNKTMILAKGATNTNMPSAPGGMAGVTKMMGSMGGSTSSGVTQSPNAGYGGYSPSGRPMAPHPEASAKTMGDAAVSEGNSAIQAAPMMGPGAPYVAIAGGVAKTAGTALQMYAAFQEAEQAEKEYKELMKEWKKAKRREEADYQRELKRQKLQDAYAGASQSAALEDRFESAYGGYRRGGQ